MRAKEIKKKKVDEGVLDSALNVVKTTAWGQQRQANATAKAAETKFSLNIATTIARAIQSGSVLQQNPNLQRQQANTANNPFNKPAPTSGPTANNPFSAPPTTESKHYQIFDTLLEALIDEIAPNTMSNASISSSNTASQSMQIKPGSISNLVKSYVNNLVRQYKWQANPELQTHSDQLADQIEGSISDPSDQEKTKYILAAKGPALVRMIQQAAATPIDQLFNTMYQWEQTGQSEEGRQQTKTAQTTPATDDATSKTRAEIPSTSQRQTIGKLGEFLSKAAQDPELLTSEEMKPYRETLKKLAAGL